MHHLNGTSFTTQGHHQHLMLPLAAPPSSSFKLSRAQYAPFWQQIRDTNGLSRSLQGYLLVLYTVQLIKLPSKTLTYTAHQAPLKDTCSSSSSPQRYLQLIKHPSKILAAHHAPTPANQQKNTFVKNFVQLCSLLSFCGCTVSVLG